MESSFECIYKYPLLKEAYTYFELNHLQINPYYDTRTIILDIRGSLADKMSICSAHPSNDAIRMMMRDIDNINVNGLIYNTNPHIGPILEIKLNDFEEIHWIKMAESHIPAILAFLEKHPENINWNYLCKNTCDEAIYILHKHLDKINWDRLSSNPNPLAVELLLNNQDNINWSYLCFNHNPDAIKLLEQNMDKINFDFIGANPNAIHIISQHLDKMNSVFISQNPNAIDILLEHTELINLTHFIMNPHAIPYLEKHLEQIIAEMDSGLTVLIHLAQNPNGSSLIEKMLERDIISKYTMMSLDLHNNRFDPFSPNIWHAPAFKHVFDLDYKAMGKIRSRIIYLELLSKALHPSKIEAKLEYHFENGGNFDDFEF